MKAKDASEVTTFTDIPNIGPAMSRDFIRIGIKKPKNLVGKNGFALYTKLCKVTKKRHDPCVLDVFLGAVDFMNGAPARPWWFYTEERKWKYPKI